MKKYVFKLLLASLSVVFLTLMTACEDPNSATQDSAKEGAEQNPTEGPDTNPTPFYAFTNDFRAYNGVDAIEGVHILLHSVKDGKQFIVPPTKYHPVPLQNMIIDMQVDGKCVEIPATAFPLLVSVCKSKECANARSLNVALTQPSHYNLSGIGGLFTPETYPVSPCSQKVLEMVTALEPFEPTK